MTMQIQMFHTGGFVIHKIALPIATRSFRTYSAWFDKDRNLLDAEGFNNQRHSLNVKVNGPVWEHLQNVGKSVALPISQENQKEQLA